MIPTPVSIPNFSTPRPPDLPSPVLELPTAEIPSYTPVVIPPAAAVSDSPPLPVVSRAKPDEPAPAPQQDLQSLVREALRQAQAEASTRQVSKPALELPETSPYEVTEFTIPATQITVPVPKAEILSAAATTSVISVGATLAATSLFKRLVQVFKPAIKAVVAKVQKMRGKPVKSWARQRLSERHRRRQAQRVNRRGS